MELLAEIALGKVFGGDEEISKKGVGILAKAQKLYLSTFAGGM